MDSNVGTGLKGGTRKTGLTGDLYARVWLGIRGPPFPQKKIEFGIGGGAISAYIKGSLAFVSLFLVSILSRSMQISTNCETHIFKKWCIPRLPVGPPVLKERCKLSQVGLGKSPLPQPK